MNDRQSARSEQHEKIKNKRKKSVPDTVNQTRVRRRGRTTSRNGRVSYCRNVVYALESVEFRFRRDGRHHFLGLCSCPNVLKKVCQSCNDRMEDRVRVGDAVRYYWQRRENIIFGSFVLNYYYSRPLSDPVRGVLFTHSARSPLAYLFRAVDQSNPVISRSLVIKATAGQSRRS